MSKPASHLLDIYSAWLHCATTDKAWATLCKKIDSLNPEPDSLGYTSLDLDSKRNGQANISIYLDEELAGRDLIETIAHEATHAASLLLDHYGHNLRGKDEPHAYLAGWIAGWLWEQAT